MLKEYHYKCANCNNDVIRTKENITHLVFCNDKCKEEIKNNQINLK